MASFPYPWLVSQWQTLNQRLTQQRLPHAVLLSGLSGLGKQAFAQAFAQRLLCETPLSNGVACGECRSCVQFQAQSHPDFLCVVPEETGKAIKIDQIRALISNLGLASHYGQYRVAMIAPAEAMNLAAANSLLKSLEEPPPQTLLLLVTSQPSRLPATIRSRCQELVFHRPSYALAQDWLCNNHPLDKEKTQELLSLSYGAPLAALSLSDTTALAEREAAFGAFYAIGTQSQSALPTDNAWLKAKLPAPIQWLYSWISDLVKIKCHFDTTITNVDKRSHLQELAEKVELSRLLTYFDAIMNYMRLQQSPLNAQMVVEDLLVQWQTLTQR